MEIQPLIAGDPMADQIVFGSLFMQNFQSQFVFNYTEGAVHKTHLLMKPLSSVPLTGTYSGSAVYSTGTNPFNPDEPVTPGDDDNSSGALVWILVIAGIALICLGIAIFFYFKSKSTEKRATLTIN